jgi:hypothetical protein
MNADIAKQILDKIVGQIFGYQNPWTLEQFAQKFAFDARLPSQVFDATTNEPGWVQSTNPAKFMTLANVRKRAEVDDFMLPKRELNSINDILAVWGETNYTPTDRVIDSINVAESDNVIGSENVYRCVEAIRSKNVVYCESPVESEYLAGVLRTQRSSFCIRTEDSQNCANSFSVSWSNKVTNSMFINDCFDVSDCLFCSHISGKQYCIANMQFTKEEYEKIRLEVIKWIFSN